MDEATRKYLIPKKLIKLPVPFTVDKETVMEITSQLLDRNDLTGELREAFDAYIGACMEYNNQRHTVVPATILAYDSILLPPKTISAFVKRTKLVREYPKTPP